MRRITLAFIALSIPALAADGSHNIELSGTGLAPSLPSLERCVDAFGGVDAAVCNVAVGIGAGINLTTQKGSMFWGNYVGSRADVPSYTLIVRTSATRMLRCDLKAETCAFQPYTPEAAMVAPEYVDRAR